MFMTVRSQSNFFESLAASWKRQYCSTIGTLAAVIIAHDQAAIVVKDVFDIKFFCGVSFAVYSISMRDFQSALFQRAWIFIILPCIILS